MYGIPGVKNYEKWNNKEVTYQLLKKSNLKAPFHFVIDKENIDSKELEKQIK